jgi:hypothetical protein
VTAGGLIATDAKQAPLSSWPLRRLELGGRKTSRLRDLKVKGVWWERPRNCPYSLCTNEETEAESNNKSTTMLDQGGRI